jgi:CubicO group peptidase (beta-lactamase class C family)
MELFNEESFQRLAEVMRTAHADGSPRAYAITTGNLEREHRSLTGGFVDADQTAPIDANSAFLIASPTKPIVATAVMMLVQRGLIRLSDRACKYLPEFATTEKRSIRIVHLLTHTSGLPDMLANNEELRQSHAPLVDFMAGTAKAQLLFKPGTRLSYQSMGILALATVIERTTAMPLGDFLWHNIFNELGMKNTQLGVAPDEADSIEIENQVQCEVESKGGATSWGWNSTYWRDLGAPWGGMMSTSDDLAKFLRHLLAIGAGETGILHPRILRAMTSNQLEGLPHINATIVRSTPWGLGWQLNWPAHPRGFGSMLPPSAFGHWGATGTLLWVDPESEVYGVVLTSAPISLENRAPLTYSNMLRASWNK